MRWCAGPEYCTVPRWLLTIRLFRFNSTSNCDINVNQTLLYFVQSHTILPRSSEPGLLHPLSRRTRPLPHTTTLHIRRTDTHHVDNHTPTSR